MARKALYKHATQVNTNTYPDDGTSPVGSNEWNENPDPNGMLGFTPQTSTVTISSGALTPTDSITVVASESGTSDTITTIALTNTNEYDLLYLFADTGDTITLTNTSSPSSNGQVKTVSNANETLSTTSPTILIRKGNYWYGYGGGVVNAVSDIGDVTISGIASGEVLKWNGSAWINQTLAESGIQGTLSNSDIATAVEAASDSNTFTDADHSKLNAVEASADVTDATNVDAAGAVMLSDSTTSGMGFVVDEDAMGSDSATKVPTQQSVVAYIASQIASDITLKGDYNASTDSPSLDDGSPISGIKKGDHYVVSVAGDFFTEGTQAGDSIIAKQDSPTTLAHWIRTNNNLTTPITNTEVSASAAIDYSKLAALNSARILVGNGSNVATSVAMSGDVGIDNAGATTIQTDAVDIAMLSAGGTAGSSTYLRGDNQWATVSSGFTSTADADLDFVGDYDIHDLQRVCLEVQGTGFDTDSNNADRTGEKQLYIRTIDSNNEGLFVKLKKNGSSQYVQVG